MKFRKLTQQPHWGIFSSLQPQNLLLSFFIVTANERDYFLSQLFRKTNGFYLPLHSGSKNLVKLYQTMQPSNEWRLVSWLLNSIFIVRTIRLAIKTYFSVVTLTEWKSTVQWPQNSAMCQCVSHSGFEVLSGQPEGNSWFLCRCP